MSENSSSNTPVKKTQRTRLLALPLWVVVGFGLSNVIIACVISVLKALGISFKGVSPVLLNTVFAAVIYILSLLIVIGAPWVIRKHATNWKELGLQRLPSWKDIGLSFVGFILYFILSALVLYVVTLLFPAFNASQTQETGFGNIARLCEYFLAFFTLVVVAPIAEETLFRGYLYGKLRKNASIWLSALITSVLFGAIHGQWNVAVDVFSLSLILCMLREVTGSIWAGILLHMLKNGIAFYLLFINPLFLGIIGG